mmetsp:Transcript_19242/g.29503  ORF Transcript_19242/g.29503 Transcript_19242/m.29503 type:complete len:110 (+) Transcript_19242:99-428(+)
MALALGSLALLLRGSRQVKAIVEPNPDFPLRWNQTYCIVSLWLVRLVRLGLLLNLPRLAYFIWVLSLEEGDYAAIRYVSRIWYCLMFLLIETCMITQAFEWLIMKNLIQ